MFFDNMNSNIQFERTNLQQIYFDRTWEDENHGSKVEAYYGMRLSDGRRPYTAQWNRTIWPPEDAVHFSWYNIQVKAYLQTNDSLVKRSA